MNTNVQDPSRLYRRRAAKVNISSEYDKSAKNELGGERKPIRMDLIIFQGAGYLVEHPLKEITKELRDAEMIDVYTPLPEYTGGGHVGILVWSFAHD